MRTPVTVLFMILVGAVLVNCGSGTETESPLSTPAFTSPIPTRLPELGLNEPIYAEDTEVSGFGPPGLPIRLYDVGLTGGELGRGRIGEDGTFAVRLETPLRIGQRVGLALGNLEGTTYSYEALRGQAIINLPVIGLLFADAAVQPRP